MSDDKNLYSSITQNEEEEQQYDNFETQDLTHPQRRRIENSSSEIKQQDVSNFTKLEFEEEEDVPLEYTPVELAANTNSNNKSTSSSDNNPVSIDSSVLAHTTKKSSSNDEVPIIHEMDGDSISVNLRADDIMDDNDRFEKDFDDDYSQDALIEKPNEEYTVDDALDKIGFGWFQGILMQILGTGWFFDGIELGLVSFIVPVLTKTWALSPLQAGLLGSVVFLGMAIGAIFGGAISDTLGRKFVVIGGMFITSFFGLASAFAPEYYSYLFIRFLVGIGLGGLIPTDFSLFMEYVPRRSRGMFGGLMNLYWGVGEIFECALGWAVLPNLGWRWFVGLSAIPGFLSLFLRLFAPESVRFLLLKNKREQAIKIMESASKLNRVPLPSGQLVLHYGNKTEKKQTTAEQLGAVFSGKLLGTSLLLYIIWFCQSLGGWGFNFLIPIVFRHVSNDNVYLNTMLVALVGTVGYILVAIVLDRIPRRVMLTTTYLLVGLIVALIAASPDPIYILLFSMIAQFFMVFPWSTVYLYTSEVYPTGCRATGMGICAVFTRIGGTITPVIGQVLYTRAFYLPFIVFGSALATSGMASLFLPIETLGKELNEKVEDVNAEDLAGFALARPVDDYAHKKKHDDDEEYVKIGDKVIEAERERLL